MFSIEMLRDGSELRHRVSLPDAMLIVLGWPEFAAQPFRVVRGRPCIATRHGIGRRVIGRIWWIYCPRSVVGPLRLGRVDGVLLACWPVRPRSAVPPTAKRLLTTTVFAAARVAESLPSPLKMVERFCTGIALNIVVLQTVSPLGGRARCSLCATGSPIPLAAAVVDAQVPRYAPLPAHAPL